MISFRSWTNFTNIIIWASLSNNLIYNTIHYKILHACEYLCMNEASWPKLISHLVDVSVTIAHVSIYRIDIDIALKALYPSSHIFT